MTWHFIGLESPLQIALELCMGNLAAGNGYGDGDNLHYGDGDGYGDYNGNGIGFGFIEDHSEGYGESS